jgi:mono/diheme cytochrome c family protein
MNMKVAAGSPDGRTGQARTTAVRAGAPGLALFLMFAGAGPCLFGQAARADAAVLQQRCARCHDADGTGRSSRGNLSEIPDFRSHKWQTSRSDAQLRVSILDGKGSHMPAFRGKISDDEARRLVSTIRSLDPTPAARAMADGPADDFERRFRQLQEELNELKKQFRELSARPREP